MSYDAAERLYYEWHKFGHSGTIPINIPEPEKALGLRKLGPLKRLDYMSDKWNEGEDVYYYHHFKKNFPMLYVDDKGEYYIKGFIRVTNPGIDDWKTKNEFVWKLPKAKDGVTKLGILELLVYEDPETAEEKSLIFGDRYYAAHVDEDYTYISSPLAITSENPGEDPIKLEGMYIAELGMPYEDAIELLKEENPEEEARDTGLTPEEAARRAREQMRVLLEQGAERRGITPEQLAQEMTRVREQRAGQPHAAYHLKYTQIKPKVVKRVRDFIIKERPWRGTATDKQSKFEGLLRDLSEIYDIPVPSLNISDPQHAQGSGFFRSSDNHIELPHYSVVTLLHEFKHAMQHHLGQPQNEEVARGWSLSLFYLAAPKHFKKAVRRAIIFFITEEDMAAPETLHFRFAQVADPSTAPIIMALEERLKEMGYRTKIRDGPATISGQAVDNAKLLYTNAPKFVVDRALRFYFRMPRVQRGEVAAELREIVANIENNPKAMRVLNWALANYRKHSRLRKNPANALTAKTFLKSIIEGVSTATFGIGIVSTILGGLFSMWAAKAIRKAKAPVMPPPPRWSSHMITMFKDAGIKDPEDIKNRVDNVWGMKPFDAKVEVYDREFGVTAIKKEANPLTYEDYKKAIKGEGWAIGDYEEMLGKVDTEKERKTVRHILEEEKEHMDELIELMECKKTKARANPEPNKYYWILWTRQEESTGAPMMPHVGQYTPEDVYQWNFPGAEEGFEENEIQVISGPLEPIKTPTRREDLRPGHYWVIYGLEGSPQWVPVEYGWGGGNDFVHIGSDWPFELTARNLRQIGGRIPPPVGYLQGKSNPRGMFKLIDEVMEYIADEYDESDETKELEEVVEEVMDDIVLPHYPITSATYKLIESRVWGRLTGKKTTKAPPRRTLSEKLQKAYEFTYKWAYTGRVKYPGEIFSFFRGKNVEVSFEQISKIFNKAVTQARKDERKMRGGKANPEVVLCPKCEAEAWLDVSGKYICIKCDYAFTHEIDPFASRFNPENPIKSKSQWRYFKARKPELFEQFQAEHPVFYEDLPERARENDALTYMDESWRLEGR